MSLPWCRKSTQLMCMLHLYGTWFGLQFPLVNKTPCMCVLPVLFADTNRATSGHHAAHACSSTCVGALQAVRPHAGAAAVGRDTAAAVQAGSHERRAGSRVRGQLGSCWLACWCCSPELGMHLRQMECEVHSERCRRRCVLLGQAEERQVHNTHSMGYVV